MKIKKEVIPEEGQISIQYALLLDCDLNKCFPPCHRHFELISSAILPSVDIVLNKEVKDPIYGHMGIIVNRKVITGKWTTEALV